MDRSTVVDWRSSSKLRGAVLFVFVTTLVGCGKYAVRPSEKEYLADRIMVFDSDGQEAVADEHILTNREGSAGGRGAGGGGCGCN